MATQDSNFDPTAEPFDWDAVARYLAGESNPDEARAVRLWLDARPERAELVGALGRSFDRLAAGDSSDIDVERALASVHARMNEPALAVERGGAPRFAPRMRPATPLWRRPASWLAAAAAVAIVAVGVARTRSGAADSTPAPAAAAYTTATGARDSLRLPDGTRVVLGPASRLTVAAGYGTTRREVALVGEGYFDVVHDAAHPFVVRAGAAAIEDIGTAFTVRADSASTVRVAVTTGRVRLSRAEGGESGVILEAGEVATLDTASRVVREATTADRELAWTRGRLVFRDAPLSQVAADLRRWYGLELRIADPALLGRHLTATFEKETPEQVLDVVGGALGVRLVRQGDVVVVGGSTRGRSPGAR
ncbi:MAG TPA: FecR domain-containing protein [Gemmatimonadaceae bacterium]|nr:FecR domain-containing protein [Gemmatimonadaceae bacterium]